jgi:hypothetical protein
VAALRRWWRQGLTGLRALARRLRRAGIGAVHRVRDRWRADSIFRRTLSTAITTLTSTAIPSPTVSAAVSAYLADHPARHRLTPSFDDEDPDEDDDELDPHWPTNRNRLWDRLD